MFTETLNSFELEEIYRIKSDGAPLRIPLGKWSFQNGLQMNSQTLDERRSNLQGIEFKCTTLEDPPYSNYSQLSNGMVQITGFVGDVWKELQDTMNFTY